MTFGLAFFFLYVTSLQHRIFTLVYLVLPFSFLVSFAIVLLGVEIPGDKKKIALAVPGKPSFAIYCGTTGK